MVRVTLFITSLLLVTIMEVPTPAYTQLGPLDLLRSLIQNNLAGPKVVHTVQKWDFDPYIAERRSIEFQKENGVMGAKLIERLGLGEDGYMEERKLQQKARDKAAGY